MLREPLKPEHIKKKIVGHWGTVPGQNFIYTHLNRVIQKYDLDMIYLSGPGHGGNEMVAQTYLEGTYSEIYPDISQDTEGMQKLFKQFSFPAGDGAVLPILHLNGFKISNPTIFARLSHEELKQFFAGCGWEPYFVEGFDPMEMHEKMAESS